MIYDTGAKAGEDDDKTAQADREVDAEDDEGYEELTSKTLSGVWIVTSAHCDPISLDSRGTTLRVAA